MMNRCSFLLALQITLCTSSLSAAVSPQKKQDTTPSPTIWSSQNAEHAYGFPEAKPKKKGLLALSVDALTFSTKSMNTSIQRDTITAVSAGNERVELWGTGGQILRMAIPDGGGLAAAVFMHHQVDMLTVEFRDTHAGGIHSAVFYLPAKEAANALSSFEQVPYASPLKLDNSCPGNPIQPGSVLVAAPNWDNAEVPAAYRALLYEHVIDRLRKDLKISQVYREGEARTGGVCPQYTIHIAIELFKPGNQIVRSATGPIGLFVGTTKMVFHVEFSDASGKFKKSEQIKVSVRDQSESTSVADRVAKSLAKHYSKAIQTKVVSEAQNNNRSSTPEAPVANSLMR